MKLFFTSTKNNEAKKTSYAYQRKYGQFNAEEADVIVAIGGDGFLLKTLHDYKKLKKPFYGINYGSIGFLMNHSRKILYDLHLHRFLRVVLASCI